MNTDQMQKFGKDAIDLAQTSFGAWTKNTQAIMSEVTRYSIKSFEDSSAAWKSSWAPRRSKRPLKCRASTFKSSCEDFVAESTRLGEAYADLAKEAYTPFEGVMAKASSGN